MWARRIFVLFIFLFLQLLVLADVLDRLDEDPMLDVSWAGVFALMISYLALAALFVIATYFYAGWLYYKANYGVNSTIAPPQLIAVAGPGGTVTYRQNAATLDITLRRRRAAKIYLYDALIDTGVLILLGAFLGLLIDQLNRLRDGIVGNERAWSLVLLPLFFFWLVLLGLIIALAVRVHGEERYQRPLGNADCCTASFGGVVFCCSVDEAQLSFADDTRYEKRAEYYATADYHALPWAFLCTPSMHYGLADCLLGWLWVLFVIAALISTILLAVRLDSTSGTSPSVATIFIPLWIVEGLFAFVAFLLFFTLCCCYRSAAVRPRGRNALFAKYSESVFGFIAVILLAVQQALIAARVDGNTDTSWNTVFIPLYILFGFALLFGCCYVSCGRTRDADSGGDDLSDDVDRSAPASATQVERRARDPTSMWGVFSAVV